LACAITNAAALTTAGYTLYATSTVKDCDRRLAYMAVLDDWFLQEAFSGERDGKLNLAFDGFDLDVPALASGELPDSMIERRDALVRELAKDHAERERGLLDDPRLCDVPINLGLVIDGDSIGLTFKESADVRLQSLNVFARSLQLGFDARERRFRHPLPSPHGR
jgi:hypothetical protein